MTLKELAFRLREGYFGALGYLMAREVDGVVGEIRPTQPREGSDGIIKFYVRDEFAEEVSKQLERDFSAAVA